MVTILSVKKASLLGVIQSEVLVSRKRPAPLDHFLTTSRFAMNSFTARKCHVRETTPSDCG